MRNTSSQPGRCELPHFSTLETTFITVLFCYTKFTKNRLDVQDKIAECDEIDFLLLENDSDELSENAEGKNKKDCRAKHNSLFY